MKRLIDADALTTAVLKKALDDAFLNGNTDMHRLLISVVAHQPTVDAVPVIRCKDCKYQPNSKRRYADNDPIAFFGHCPYMKPYDFCSFARPKE